MSFPILGSPKPTFQNSSGAPLAAGTLAILKPEDDTNKASFPTADNADAGTNPNINPIVLDARGEPPNGLFGQDNEAYKLVLKDSIGAPIWTVDDVRCPTREPNYGETPQTLEDAGAVSLTTPVTHIITTTASALTLADGTNGQRKFIVMKTDGGDATLTPTNFANGTSIVFDDVDDSASLIFLNDKWYMIGGTATLPGGNILLAADLEAAGFNIQSLGVILMKEQAAADTDVAGEGQWWIKTATPNEPYFTDDAGGDQLLDPARSEINTQNAAYTLVLGDKGKTIYKATSTASITHTIPANSSVAFQLGTLIGWQNDGTVDMTIAITTDTLTGTDAATGSRTLGPSHAAVIQKMTATTWKYAASDL